MSSPSSNGYPERVAVRQPPRPKTLAFVLSIIILVLYSAFVYLVGFEKAFLGTTVTPGLSWGILLGALVIVVSWVLTFVYLLAFKQPAAAPRP